MPQAVDNRSPRGTRSTRCQITGTISRQLQARYRQSFAPQKTSTRHNDQQSSNKDRWRKPSPLLLYDEIAEQIDSHSSNHDADEPLDQTIRVVSTVRLLLRHIQQSGAIGKVKAAIGWRPAVCDSEPSEPADAPPA